MAEENKHPTLDLERAPDTLDDALPDPTESLSDAVVTSRLLASANRRHSELLADLEAGAPWTPEVRGELKSLEEYIGMLEQVNHTSLNEGNVEKKAFGWGC